MTKIIPIGEALALKEIAYRSPRVYLDNCILNAGSTQAGLGKLPYRCPEGSLSHAMGKARNFSGLKLSTVLRERKYVGTLLELIKDHPHLTTPPDVLVNEFAPLIRHIRRSTAYLRGKSSGKKGIRETTLREISKDQQTAYALLLGRAQVKQGHSQLRRWLRWDQYSNCPVSPAFKRRKSSPVDRGDASLVASAYVDSNTPFGTPISIVSCDTDIPNMIGNIGNECNGDGMQDRLHLHPQTPIEVWMPVGECLSENKLVLRFTPGQRLECLLVPA